MPPFTVWIVPYADAPAPDPIKVHVAYDSTEAATVATTLVSSANLIWGVDVRDNADQVVMSLPFGRPHAKKEQD